MTTTTTAPTVRFEAGAFASATSACDSDCVWTFEVVGRTAKFVTLKDTLSGDVTRSKVHVDRHGNESTLPFGTFSMAPVASPTRED